MTCANCSKEADGIRPAGSMNPYAVGAGALALLAAASMPTQAQAQAMTTTQAGAPVGQSAGVSLVACRDAAGRPGLAVPGGACVACDCAGVSQTGTGGCTGPGQWNAGIIRANLSAQDVERIMSAFQSETVTRTGASGDVQAVNDADGNAVAGWFSVRLGSLGVSHTLEVTEVSALLADGVTAAAVTNLGLQAERYAEENGVGYQVWDNPKFADPEDLDITPEKCACEKLGVCIVDEGRERVLFQSATFVIGAAAAVTMKLKRKDWATRCSACLAPGDARPQVGGRIVITSAAPATRSTPGAIPMFPV